jgi:hypothetical protein
MWSEIKLSLRMAPQYPLFCLSRNPIPMKAYTRRQTIPRTEKEGEGVAVQTAPTHDKTSDHEARAKGGDVFDQHPFP